MCKFQRCNLYTGAVDLRCRLVWVQPAQLLV